MPCEDRDTLSGKRRGNVKRQRNRAGRLFCVMARSLARSKDIALGGFYRRMAARRGGLVVEPGLVARMVREDGVDVLVDLSMHMAGNRMLLFARKPAPVQVTYLAYCSTTGLKAIDYRLTDPYLDPPGCDEAVYSEQTVRLPETYWCYGPPSEAPPCSGVPALQSGHVTFGCLNNFCKVTGATLAAWSRLLQAVPDAHLLLHAQAGSHRDRVRDYFDSIPNLYLVGRNGMHRYNNQDHSMLSAKAAVDVMLSGSTDKSSLWAVNAEDEYHEVRRAS